MAVTQCGKTRNFFLRKKIRQINSLVNSSLKTLFSRNFCKSEIEFLAHSMEKGVYHWFYECFVSIIRKIFRENNFT